MTEEILPNLYRIVVPLPGNPLKEINSYVLTSKDRNTVIDTGMHRVECREVLEAGLAEIGVDLEKTDFVVTHLHADHQGLVSTLLRDGSKAYMGEPDAVFLKTRIGGPRINPAMTDYAGLNGFSAEELQASLVNHPGFKYGTPAQVDYIHLKGGETFEIGDYSFHTIPTPGHTYGHMCLYEPHKKILFSGDHVLGDITPNIQAWSDDRDPLKLYIKSLKSIMDLDVALCLPGHRTIIKDFRKRIEELIEHHRRRANEVISILERGSKNAYQTASEMTWDIVADSWEAFPIMQKWFGTGETIAHLRYLEELGLIHREVREGQIVYSTDGKTRL